MMKRTFDIAYVNESAGFENVAKALKNKQYILESKLK
jgi:hypothetical protein